MAPFCLQGAATPTVRPASPVQPLRPSSRQDHRADALHLPSKPGAQLPSPHSAACAEDGDSTASVRIVPASQGADGESRLVVVLGSAPAPVPVPAPASQSAEQVALVVGACCTAVEVASGMDGAGAAAAALEAELDLGGLGLLCGEGSASRASLQELEVEDAQAELELGGAAAQDVGAWQGAGPCGAAPAPAPADGGSCVSACLRPAADPLACMLVHAAPAAGRGGGVCLGGAQARLCLHRRGGRGGAAAERG